MILFSVKIVHNTRKICKMQSSIVKIVGKMMDIIRILVYTILQ